MQTYVHRYTINIQDPHTGELLASIAAAVVTENQDATAPRTVMQAVQQAKDTYSKMFPQVDVDLLKFVAEDAA
jgi:hypothetical protein